MTHPALKAMTRAKDLSFGGMGFDFANALGRLGSYMEMLNRSGSGGYPLRVIVAAKKKPGFDPYNGRKAKQ